MKPDARPSESLVGPSREGLPNLCGGDYELGNFLTGISLRDGTGYWASRALLAEFDGVPGDAGSWGRLGALPPTPALGELEPPTGVSSATSDANAQDWGRVFLFNGGCAYVDLNHLEVCLPEVLSARAHVAYAHAMYRLAARAAAAANRKLEGRWKIHVLANNSDGQGNSYGSHLNFLVTRRAWENLFHRRIHYQLYLASYQASSLVFTGQGKVGSEHQAPRVAYQLSQRADFFEVLVGPQTTYRRPLVNSRDEALNGLGRADSAEDRAAGPMARLHVIGYDHNLCHVAAWLKVGVLQIVLAMIEAEQVNPELALEDPVEAVGLWSRDPALRVRAKLVTGPAVTALELQRRFLDAAAGFVAAGRCEGLVPDAEEIVERWAETLEHLAALRLDRLAPSLDWVLKFTLLEQAARERPALTWESPELKHLDHLYSSLDPAEGLYFACERSGVVHRLAPETQVARCVCEPPADTRAWTRAALLLMTDPLAVDRVDWDFMRFRLEELGPWAAPRYVTVSLANPLAHTREEFQRRLPESGTLSDALEALAATGAAHGIGSPPELPATADPPKLTSPEMPRPDQEHPPAEPTVELPPKAGSDGPPEGLRPEPSNPNRRSS